MTELRWNPNNTEGAWPVSYDFIDTELRKGEKIVATDLTDLYDVLITNVQDEEILLYDGGIEKWVNGAAGGGCSIIDINTEYSIGVEDGEGEGEGEEPEEADFITLKDAFDWLRENCMIITEDATVTLKILSQLTITEPTYLNHPYGHRIEINLGGQYIYVRPVINYYNKQLFLQEYGVKIACGHSHTAMIREDGTLWGCGRNSDYQLGIGSSTSDRDTFIQESRGDTDWVFIACGHYHSMAIKSDGTLWVAGENYYGQLGMGDNGHGTERRYFTQVGTDTDWAYVNGGYSNTMAIKTDGTLWATGYGNYGQTGQGNYTQINEFSQEAREDTDWVKCCCGGHSMALKTDGTLWGCGYNRFGSLGNNDTTYGNHTFVQEYHGYTNWKDVDISLYGTVAIRDDGSLWTCGSNVDGQCGWGYVGGQAQIFTRVGIETQWNKCGAGYNNNLSAIKNNGTLWGAGNNYYGQLGLSGTADRSLFTQEATERSDWEHISFGYFHGMCLSTDTKSHGTGRNTDGQLGIDNTSTRYGYVLTGYYAWYKRVNKEEIKEGMENRLYLTDSHSIKDIRNGVIYVSAYMYSQASEGIYLDEPNDIIFPGLEISNNSNLNSTYQLNLSGYIGGDINFTYAPLWIKNNSYVDYDNVAHSSSNQYVIMENGSTFRSDNYGFNLLAKNSTVITETGTMFDDSTFINSKLIEYK